QAIVAQAKVDTNAMAKFIDKPELLGFSLAGSFKGAPSVFDPSGSIYTAGSSGGSSSGSRDSSLDSLRDPDVNPTAPKLKPSLKTASNGHANSDSSVSEEHGGDKVRSEEGVIRLEARLVNLNVKATDRSGTSLSS